MMNNVKGFLATAFPAHIGLKSEQTHFREFPAPIHTIRGIWFDRFEEKRFQLGLGTDVAEIRMKHFATAFSHLGK